MSRVGHTTLLHEMRLWHIRAAIRSNERHSRPIWEVGRMVSFVMAASFGAGEDLKKFSDLIQFPWDADKPEGSTFTDEEADELLRIINEENSKLNK